jgi:hypothetical protein
MSRRTCKRKSRRGGTVYIPKTKKAIKKMGQRTVKRVRFFMKDVACRIKKIPSYLDRTMSRAVRSVTRRRR